MKVHEILLQHCALVQQEPAFINGQERFVIDIKLRKQGKGQYFLCQLLITHFCHMWQLWAKVTTLCAAELELSP